MKRITLLVLILAPLVALAHHSHQGADGLGDVTVLIVRHAEKPDAGSGLSAQGQQRARAYAGYFDPLHLGEQNLLPRRLIATKDSKSSERPRLTLEPLAARLQLPLEQHWKDDQTDKLVASLRKRNHAPVILIAWHHGQMGHLLSAFGADPRALLAGKHWPADVYNWLLVLRFDDHGQLIPAQSRRVQEHLLPGD